MFNNPAADCLLLLWSSTGAGVGAGSILSTLGWGHVDVESSASAWGGELTRVRKHFDPETTAEGPTDWV